MSDAERIELLKEVARVAPKEMGVWLANDYEGLVVRLTVDIPRINESRASRTYPFLTLLNDTVDAEACFAMLDAMECAGWNTSLETGRRIPPAPFACLVERRVNQRLLQAGGGTRAEAVARAFVQVFGGGSE